MRPAIYFASKTRHAPQWRQLRRYGVLVNSTWIDEAGVGETADFADLWSRCVREASSADALIVYSEPGETLKGALVEVGAALASGRRVYAVGLPSTLSVLSHPLVTACEDVYQAVKLATEGYGAARAIADGLERGHP